MKHTQQIFWSCIISILSLVIFNPASAQSYQKSDYHSRTVNHSEKDVVKSDAQHYTVIFENHKVRVLQATYAANEKSGMHYHPDAVVVNLTDNAMTATAPDGSERNFNTVTGQAVWSPSGFHQMENASDNSMSTIIIELK